MGERNPWQDPCVDVLELILRKLSYFDLPSFSSVCSSWYKAKKTYTPFSHPILLSIADNQTDGCASNQLNLRLHTLPEGNAANVVVPLSERFHQFICIGRSKQILVLADMKTRTQIVLIDRFLRQSFCLAPLVPPVLKFRKSTDLFEVIISKVVVLVMSEKKSGDDLMNNIVVVAIFSSPRRCMAYYRDGSWAVLDCSIDYSDIVARDTRLFALDVADMVKVWDFNQSSTDCPTMVMKFKSSIKLPHPRVSPRTYLVESKGEILVVQRHRIDNSKVEPRERFQDPNFRWRNFNWFSTIGFQVFKSRLARGEKWVEVDSLGDDVALFLGRNESVSVSIRDLPQGYQGNSIYFTHNYSVNYNYDINSGEIGVYSLEHKNIKFFHALDDHLNGPTPVWMV